MTRGLAEIARLGLALGAERQTFMGLAGMGDLILTCTGDLSRNRRVGLALAQNKSLPPWKSSAMSRRVYTAREVDQLSRKLAVDMPISAAVAAVLDGRLTAAQARTIDVPRPARKSPNRRRESRSAARPRIP
jgi:glycerol-3-phosphate dehydrogenase (NAD(P)+)